LFLALFQHLFCPLELCDISVAGPPAEIAALLTIYRLAGMSYPAFLSTSRDYSEVVRVCPFSSLAGVLGEDPLILRVDYILEQIRIPDEVIWNMLNSR